MALNYDELYELRRLGLSDRRISSVTSIPWSDLNARLRDQSFTSEEKVKINALIKDWKQENGTVNS